MRHTLSRRLLAFGTALTAGMLLLAAVSLWGLMMLRDTLTETVHEYEELRLVEGVQQHINRAKLALIAGDLGQVRGEIEESRARLAAFAEYQATEHPVENEHQAREQTAHERVREELERADPILSMATAGVPGAPDLLKDVLDRAGGHADILAGTTDVDAIADHAVNRARTGLLGVSAALVVLLGAGVLLGLSAYRSVMSPLGRLRQRVREIRGGHLDQRLAPERDQEFADLANDFNGMVGELDSLYRTLEEKVATRSRELVRSERLASVGFLAAGVAHEISTPLNIITGYAELSQKDVARLDGSVEAQRIRENLVILCEEAYRCKQIIQQLLSLARRSEGERTEIWLSAIADSVAAMLAGIERYRDKRILVNVRRERPLTTIGNEAELKQVLLNLSVNALEAVQAGTGWVRIDVERRGDRVQMSVVDNGVGMSPDVLEHVFEPFFSKRSEWGARGVGLGLSVSHAIIESHGGRLQAFSDGPGRGSRFVVELPAADGGKHDPIVAVARGEPARADR